MKAIWENDSTPETPPPETDFDHAALRGPHTPALEAFFATARKMRIAQDAFRRCTIDDRRRLAIGMRKLESSFDAMLSCIPPPETLPGLELTSLTRDDIDHQYLQSVLQSTPPPDQEEAVRS